jgi:hypothetical protein
MTATYTEVLIGYVGVDSGQLMLCDPCYIDKDFPTEEFNPDQPDDRGTYPMTYNGACGATLSDKRFGELGHGLAVAFSSGLGDGTYPVYATIVDDPMWGKRVASVRVVMMEEGDND